MSEPARPAYDLVVLIRRQYGSDKGFSDAWVLLNSALGDAIRLAITAGLHFEPDDYTAIQHVTDGHDTPSDYDYHALAIRAGNRSAADSIDAYHGRKALKVGKHFVGEWPNERYCLPNRVFVGAKFTTDGERFTVTSIADDGESCIACAYHSHPESRRIKRRITLTRSELAPKKAPGVPDGE